MNPLQQHNASGAIVGVNASIDGVKTANQLGAFLNNYDKPYYTPSNVSDSLYVATGGSNVTGNGSISRPFADIGRAIQMHGTSNGNAKNIICLDTGSFDLPLELTGANFLNIIGAEEYEATRNVSSVTVIPGQYITFTVDGATLADDEWQDRHLYLTGALSNTRNIVVARNIGNVIYGVMYNRNNQTSVQSSFSSGVVRPIVWSTLENNNGTRTMYQDCNQLSFRQVVFSSPNDNTNFRGGNVIEFWKCQIEARQIAQISGNLFLFSCSIANTGGTAPVLSAGYLSQTIIGVGSVISDRNISGAQNYINVFFGGRVSAQGLTIFRGTYGVAINGGFLDNAVGDGFWHFEAFTGTPSNFRVARFNGAGLQYGGEHRLPVCTGEISEDYFVQAKLGARVYITSTTSVDTATVTNAVSADLNASASAHAIDGTEIRGGVPEYNQGWTATTRVTATTHSITADMNTIYYDTDSNAIAAALPAGIQGATYRLINCGSSGNDVTLSPNGSELLKGANSSITLSDDEIAILTYDTIEGWW